MKKSCLQLIVALFVLFGNVDAQWNWRHWFPSKATPHVPVTDTLIRGNVHGIAVDPDGKVWITDYYAYSRDTIRVPNYMVSGKDTSHVDSVKKYIASVAVAVRVIYCFNKDGSQASFSPIKSLVINGVADTIGGNSILIKGIPVFHASLSVRTNRGLATDHNGNILASVGAFIYRINYKTGAGMARLDTDPLLAFQSKNSITASASDQNGNIFVHRVVNANQPIKIYDANFNYIGNVVDTATKATGFSRSIAVSKSGNDVYYSSYEHSYALRFNSANGILGPYVFKDTLFKGLSIETFTWDKKTGYLWVSSGSYLSLPNRHWTKTYWSYATWYGFDMTNPASPVLKDSLKWDFYTWQNANERPRGFAFSMTSDTAYAGVFGDATIHGVKVYTKGATGVRQVLNAVAESFSLDQNYPNPFNPTTRISFTLKEASNISLKVYDIVGKEVANLAEGKFAASKYEVGFNASNLMSGTYFYTLLTSSGFSQTKKMVLLK